ncbi:uncharacterized protein LOC110750136, partial [Prunus avium]|uniref:Uncharacterized protein LOC110750136 n=1 Tax=Prunus avium TaxID=42229 RepID=A0A6P5RWM1_PRUAV
MKILIWIKAVSKSMVCEVCNIYEEIRAEMQNLQKYLASEFEMKSLGDLKYFLGIEVARSKHEMQNLQKYLASEFEMKSLGDLKYFLGIEVARSKHVPIDKERYQRLVEKLNYLAHTRPDIAYVVSVVSQFMHSPSKDHKGVVMRVLRYLKVTPGKGLMFSKYGHTDVEGYFTFVGGNLVTWRSKKQKVVSRSSAKAEYRGMAQ